MRQKNICRGTERKVFKTPFFMKRRALKEIAKTFLSWIDSRGS